MPHVRSTPFQFGLRSLIGLTTVFAVLAGVSRWLFGPTHLTVFVLVYFGLLTLIVFWRSARIVGVYLPQLKRIREEIAALEYPG